MIWFTRFSSQKKTILNVLNLVFGSTFSELLVYQRRGAHCSLIVQSLWGKDDAINGNCLQQHHISFFLSFSSLPCHLEGSSSGLLCALKGNTDSYRFWHSHTEQGLWAYIFQAGSFRQSPTKGACPCKIDREERKRKWDMTHGEMKEQGKFVVSTCLRQKYHWVRHKLG